MRGKAMTPDDEEMTIGDAQARISAALGVDEMLYVTRGPAVPGSDVCKPWSAWVVTGPRDTEGKKQTVITVHDDRLGAALAQLVRECEGRR
jgi:hypothetical protein